MTPHIDGLAKNGILLLSHYTGWVCGPTRASFLTGRYSYRLGFAQSPDPTMNLPLNENTLSSELQALGYRTAIVGKWGLGAQAWAYTPLYRGFDSFFGLK